MSSPAAQSLGYLLHYVPYQSFNKVQEAVIPALFSSDRNCLIAAPTGSGKTLLLEVAMLRLFRNRLLDASQKSRKIEDDDGGPATKTATDRDKKDKAVYVCPIKALANEKYEHWRSQFPSLSVVIETGDQMQYRSTQHRTTTEDSGIGATEAAAAAAEDMTSVSRADILVTTPERWDSITRRWKEKEVMAIVNSVGLLLLDEVHTVQEERGAAMEAIVSRVKAIQAATAHDAANQTRTRIVAISGTLPNARDMAEWLEVSPEMTFAFSASDRPVPLTVKVISYAHDVANPFAFHRFLSFKLFGLIQQFSEGKPTLVFCSSRKEVTSSAARLVEDIRDAATRRGQLAQLQPSEETRRLSQQASDKQLRNCLLGGVGFHHAAMTMEDRLLVERMFREQYIAVLCSTTTLALGVNLPAHLVLIKGTTFFGNGQCQDMSVSEVLQMCGRAGRPGLDAHGVALVLTTQRKSHIYDTLRNGAVALTCVESHLHRHMIEHVNAEVALRTIQNFHSAIEWAKTTFFWIRLRQCPRHYGLAFANRAEEDEFSAEDFVEALMERVLRVLVEEGCVSISQATRTQVWLEAGLVPSAAETASGATVQNSLDSAGGAGDVRCPTIVFEPTRLGRAMSRMYILFDSVCVLNAEVQKRGSMTHIQQPGKADVKCATIDDAADRTKEVAEKEVEAATPSLPSTKGDREDSTAEPSMKTGAVTAFTLQETLQLLCQCQELVEVRLRQGDRGPLNEINRAVRFPLHSGRRGGREVREDWHKAYLLIQAHVGLLPITEVSLRNDAQRLWSVVPRVSRFLEEYAWARTSSYSLACCANVLARSMERRVWPDGPVVRQLQHVSDVVAKSLLRGGYRGFDSLRDVDARQLEVLCSRLPPFGNQVLTQVHNLPRLQLELEAGDVKEREYKGTTAASQVQKSTGSVRVYLCRPAETDVPTREGNVVPSSVGATFDVEECGTARGCEGLKRHGGKAALTESAMRDGGVLLIVGDPARDTVLLKRFVPLFPKHSGTRSSKIAPQQQERIEIASFTFHIPLSLFRTRIAGAAHSSIEARCFVLHMVGLDVSAEVSGEHPSAAGELPRTAPLMNNQTLDPYLVSTTAQNSNTSKAKEKTNATASALTKHDKAGHEGDHSGRTDTPQTVAAAEIAAEARDSFNALLADMTYVASDNTAAKRPQQPEQRKRSRTEAAAEPDETNSSSLAEAACAVEQEPAPQCVVKSAAKVALQISPDIRDGASGERADELAAAGVCTPEGGVAAAYVDGSSIRPEGAEAARTPTQYYGQRSHLETPRKQQRNEVLHAARSLVEDTTEHTSCANRRPLAGVTEPETLQIYGQRESALPVRLSRCASPPATCPLANTQAPSYAVEFSSEFPASQMPFAVHYDAFNRGVTGRHGGMPMYCSESPYGSRRVELRTPLYPSSTHVPQEPGYSRCFQPRSTTFSHPLQPRDFSEASVNPYAYEARGRQEEMRTCCTGIGGPLDRAGDGLGGVRFPGAACPSSQFDTYATSSQWPPLSYAGAYDRQLQYTRSHLAPFATHGAMVAQAARTESTRRSERLFPPFPPQHVHSAWGPPAVAEQWTSGYPVHAHPPIPFASPAALARGLPRSLNEYDTGGVDRSALSRSWHQSQCPPFSFTNERGDQPPPLSTAPPMRWDAPASSSIPSVVARAPSMAPLLPNRGRSTPLPNASATLPATSGRFTPHVRRSAMVSRSWWQ